MGTFQPMTINSNMTTGCYTTSSSGRNIEYVTPGCSYGPPVSPQEQLTFRQYPEVNSIGGSSEVNYLSTGIPPSQFSTAIETSAISINQVPIMSTYQTHNNRIILAPGIPPLITSMNNNNPMDNRDIPGPSGV